MRYKELLENSSAGSTSSSNIAIVPGNQTMIRRAIGAGFDPDGDFGIYNFAKNKKLKENISDVENEWEKLDINFHISERGEYIKLNKIIVPEDLRNSGIGSKAMKILIDYADKNSKIIALTPDESYGGKISKLKKFYKKFGFVENKGKNKDFSTMDSFIRYPKNHLTK